RTRTQGEVSMNSEKSLNLTVYTLLALLFLAACRGTLTPTPITVPPTVTPKPPTVAPPTTQPTTNHKPSANNSHMTVQQDTPASIDLNTLASDIDGDQLTFAIQTRPNNADAVVVASTLIFTPTPG